MARNFPAGPLRLAVDTNILLLLIVYEYFTNGNARPPERVRVLNDVRGRDDGLPRERFDELWQIFRGAAHRLVTQHVVGEALKFKRPGWLTDRKEISWRCAVSLLSKYGVEEHPCCIRDLYANGVYRKALIELGATDAGLLHAAQQDNATLVSDDESLLRWAHIRGVPAFPLSRIHLAAQYP